MVVMVIVINPAGEMPPASPSELSGAEHLSLEDEGSG
jgi:hypothetical protein